MADPSAATARGGAPRWSTESTPALLYADDPLPATARDDLDRRRLAEQLGRAITNVANQSPSAVVALVGPWGSGKSTILGAIEAYLGTEAGWHLARHNPWTYSTYESAVAGFFSELRAALPPETMGKDIRGAIGDWVNRIAPLGAVGGVVGVNATGAVAAAGSLLSGDRSPEKLRECASAALEGLDRPLLVVLDDLDRLQPQELLLTFKLVRLLGRLPNVYYLLAYDEETLTDVLNRTDLVGAGDGRAQQYLEKMIQVRLDIPPLLEEQKLDLVNQGIEDLCDQHATVLSVDGNDRLQHAWNECLSAYLDQPRAMKRWFTQIDAHWPDVKGEVDFVDFALVTFLRTFERPAFDLMITRRNELLGLDASQLMNDRETNKDRWNRWVNLLQQRGVRHPEELAMLFAELFLVLRGARENMTYGSHYRDGVRERCGVGSDEFFDRYVQIGVPRSDLPERVVNEAVLEMRSEQDGQALAELRGWLRKDATKAIRKLARIHETAPLPTERALLLIGDHYELAMQQKAGFLLSPDFGMLMLSIDLIGRVDFASAERLVQILAESNDSGLTMSADIVQKIMFSDDPAELKDRISPVAILVADALEARLRASSRSPVDGNARIIKDGYGLVHLRGQQEAQELFWLLVEGSESWKIEELLALMVPIGTASDGRRSWPSMGELSVGDVDTLLGLDRVLDALPEELPLPAHESDFERRRAQVSHEERRRYALSVMRRAREQRSEQRAKDGEHEGVVSPLPD